MKHFCYDVETLSLKEVGVVLSAAIVEFNPLGGETMSQLLEKTLLVKFDAAEQARDGRVIDDDVVEWWKKQDPEVQKVSLGSAWTVPTIHGINTLRKYITDRVGVGDDYVFWTRGSLDQFITDSLCESAGQKPLVPYKFYRDVRTAIDLLYGSSNGYTSIPKDMVDVQIRKHDPRHDVCLDALMLASGETFGGK